MAGLYFKRREVRRQLAVALAVCLLASPWNTEEKTIASKNNPAGAPLGAVRKANE